MKVPDPHRRHPVAPRIHLWAALLLGFIASALPIHAAKPRDEVLRLVPDDVGFCFLIQDLRGHARAFLESPFFARLRSSALGRELAASPHAQKLAEVEKHLKKSLDLSWQTLCDDILGDAVVFAFRVNRDGPEEEQGLIVLRARDPKRLAQTVERLNEVQKQ